MNNLMNRLYDNIDEAKAFALSFTNFVYFYDDLCFEDFETVVCEECRKRVQDRDYLAPKANCKKPTGILHSFDFGVNQELRDELIARFDITEEDFRPVRTKKGEIVYYQITPRHVMLPVHEVNGWPITTTCPKCGSVQYDMFEYYNEKDEPYGYISSAALENLPDLSVSYEKHLRYGQYYMISRRVYDFLTERYPRTHYCPFFLKED